MLRLVLPLALAACGTYVPMRTALVDTHAPPDLSYAKDKFVANDGLELYEQRWAPTGAVRGAVVLVHGLKDHSSRYRDLAVTLAEHGFVIHTYDVRGHGYSAGVRDHVGSVARCLDDLDRVVARVRLRNPDKPLFLLGQGFGGTIAGLYVVRAQPKLAGLILSAPTIRGARMTATERFGDQVTGIFTPRAGRMSLDFAAFTTDRRAVEQLREDPLIAPGAVTSGTTRALLVASDELRRRSGEIKVPLLVLDGADDKISDDEAVRALAGAAGGQDKTLTVYPGLEYDLFHEKARDQVTTDTVDWLKKEATLAAPAPAPSAAPDPGIVPRENPPAPDPAPAAKRTPARHARHPAKAR